MDPPKERLPVWARLIPHYLKPAGYRCYHSGKWHIFGAPMPCQDGGFDHSYRLDDQDRFFSPQKHWEDDQPLPAVATGSGYYATTAIADHAIHCLREHATDYSDRPFFHYLAFTSPHFPLQALQADIDRYRELYTIGWDAVRQSRWLRMRDRGIINCELSRLEPDVKPDWNLAAEELRKQIGFGEVSNAIPWNELTQDQKKFQAHKMAIHAAMIDRMDREIGRVLDQLRSMGDFENTVILFVSDNGASAEQMIRGDLHDPSVPPGSPRSFLCLGPGWSSAANTPFRLHKSWVHEGGIASPLLVHWPNGLPARGELRNNPGHFVDLLPAILDLAGISPSPTWKEKPVPQLAGRSLAPAFSSDDSVPHDFLYFHHLNNRAIRIGDWKLVSAGSQGPWELYNLKKDRCEMKDLAAQHGEKVQELAMIWENHDTEFNRMAASES